MHPSPKSQLASAATLLTVVNSFTETGQTSVTSVTSPTCLPGFLLPNTDPEMLYKPSSVHLPSHLSKSQTRDKSLSSKLQAKVSILQV